MNKGVISSYEAYVQAAAALHTAGENSQALRLAEKACKMKPEIGRAHV